MSRTYHIFVPEWVPLENKGEEAIIRGMGDVLFPEGNVEFHILDILSEEYRYVDGLHVYPRSWFYSEWRSQEFGLGLSFRKLYASGCSLVRNGLNLVVPKWIKYPQYPVIRTAREMRKVRRGTAPDNEKTRALKRILDCDYLIAGHDGALDEYDCHVIRMMQEFGMEFGVFGSTMRPSVKSRPIIEVFCETLRDAHFIYCRDQIALDWATRNFGELHSELAPDPAFGMFPSSKEWVSRIIASEGLEDFFKKPVVMVASSETPPIARHSFVQAKLPHEKINAHRDLLAVLIKHIAQKHDANILFLPHAIGPGIDLDDRCVARDVLRRAGLPQDRARVLETELNAKDLKGIIREGEMLVSERIHAIIGATGVHTPFCSLGSKTDNRVRGIIGNMLKMEDVTYYLNDPSEQGLLEHFDQAWARREELRERLKGVHAHLDRRLEEAAFVIRARMGVEFASQEQGS